VKGVSTKQSRDIGHVDALCPAPPGMSTTPIQSRVTSSSSLPTQGNVPPNTNSGQNTPALLPQQPAFPPQQNTQQPIQGFIPSSGPRRKSSTSTITTATTAQDFGPSQTVRPYPTLPNQRTGNVTFPTPSPAPNLVRSDTIRTVETAILSPGTSMSGHTDYYSQSDVTHGDDRDMRLSTNTSATFGKWDNGLRNALNYDDVGTLLSVSEHSPVSLH
jgi:hypothetical protein